MADTYEGPSIDTSDAEYTGPITKSFPFLDKFGDTTHVIYSQKFIQLWDDYAPPALNDDETIGGGTVYFIGDVGLNDIGTGCVEFERRWANVPAAHSDYERTAVVYPGWLLMRNPSAQTVATQVLYEYFIVGTGETYETPAEIPVTGETRVTDTNGLDVAILSGAILNNGGGVLYTTTPTISGYYATVTADLVPEVYSIVLASSIEHYTGGIWARVTRSVKAK